MEQEHPMALVLEQEFKLQAFEEQIKDISLEQAKFLLSQLNRQLLLRETYFKRFIKKSLPTDSPLD
jgi:hypothetical protein